MTADPSFLREVPLFASLDEDELKVLASAVGERALAAGETLFRAGEPGDALFIVRQGAVELFATDTTGHKIVFHTATGGEYFGELSLLDSGPRTATAQATEPTELFAVDRDDLLQLFKKRPDAALELLSTMGKMTRRSGALLARHGVRNVNTEIEFKSTFSEKVADLIAAFSGSMEFFYANCVFFAIWIGWNVFAGSRAFDPFPFGLLTMIVSLEAIFLACFVLLSQNRQAAKDKVRSDIEYEVNIKAELEVAHLHEKADRIYEEMLDRFTRLEKELRGRPGRV
jgi:CRP/FNR family transcriptional regulator, cyclic AMP receptor protein